MNYLQGQTIYDYFNKKPQAVDPERMVQASKAAALGNALSLVGQGIFGARGATITPSQDIVTPFVLGEFMKQRERDAAEDIQTRQMFLRDVLSREREDDLLERQQLFSREQAEAQRKYQSEREDDLLERQQLFSREQAEAQRKYQSERDRELRKYQEERAEEDVRQYGRKRAIDFDYQQKILGTKEQTPKKVNEQWKIGDDGLTTVEFNNLKWFAQGLLDDPNIRQRFIDKGKYKFIDQQSRLSNDEWVQLYSEIWDELRPYYLKVREYFRNEYAPETFTEKPQAAPTPPSTWDPMKQTKENLDYYLKNRWTTPLPKKGEMINIEW